MCDEREVCDRCGEEWCDGIKSCDECGEDMSCNGGDLCHRCKQQKFIDEDDDFHPDAFSHYGVY